MTQLFETLPQIDLDAEEKSRLEGIMAAGSVVLKSLYKKVKAQFRRHQPGVKYTPPTFRIELFQAMDKGGRIVIHGVRIHAEDLRKIQAVRDIQFRMLCGYSNAISNRANQWIHKVNLGEFDDLYNEAIQSAINAIYNYSNRKVKFITYLYQALKRHLVRVSTRQKPLSHWVSDDRDLYVAFTKLQRQMVADNKGNPVDFDTVADIMKLDKGQRDLIRSMTVKVKRQADVSTTGLDGEPEDLLESEETPVEVKADTDLWDAVRHADLNEFERAVLHAYLHDDGPGWRTVVAAQHINPRTNKPFTRAAPAIALRSAIEKVKAAYTKAA
jgi:DNA-directed RNA polymerase specialized sigma subunit